MTTYLITGASGFVGQYFIDLLVSTMGDKIRIVTTTRNLNVFSNYPNIEKENVELWKQRTINCRNRIEKKYSLDKMINEYEKIWDSLI